MKLSWISLFTFAITSISMTVSTNANPVVNNRQFENISNVIGYAHVNGMADPGGINNELQHSAFKRLFNEILELKRGRTGEMIKIFLNNTEHWNWTIREGTLPENVNGQTKFISGRLVTTLDYSKLKTATNLSVARTILHEMIHAYLTFSFLYNPEYATEEFPQVLIDWRASNNPDLNKIHHAAIEEYFVDDIAESLYEFGENVGLIIPDQSVFNDLAWGGLDFESNSLFSLEDKKRIESRLDAEQFNLSLNSQNPVGIELVKN